MSNDELGPVDYVITVAREMLGTTTSNTIDHAIQAYLNPGAWTRGRTDFALVNGSNVFIYSLKKPPNETRRIRGLCTYSDEVYDQTLGSQFIFALRASGYFPKLTFLGRYKPPLPKFNFTSPDKLLVLIPDLHVNLFRQTVIDGFVEGPLNLPKSQAQTMATFLKVIDEFKKGKDVKVYQLGDLMDIWIAQGVFVMAHRFLQEQVEKGLLKEFEYFYSPLTREIGTTFKPGLKSRKVLLSDWPHKANGFDAWILCCLKNGVDKAIVGKSIWPNLPTTLLNVTVDYTNRQDVENKTREQYPEISDKYWQLLTSNWVRGNHDMDSEHPWLKDRYKFSLDDDYAALHPNINPPEWKRWDDEEVTLLSKRGYGILDGKDDCIWLEHGHSFDPYNHRVVWYREETKPIEDDIAIHFAEPNFLSGGFKTTWGTIDSKVKGEMEMGSLSGSVKSEIEMEIMGDKVGGMVEMPSGLTSDVVETKDYFGDYGLEFYSYNRTCKIFEKHGKGGSPINLVILAHTHVPHLEDYGDFKRRPWQMRTYDFLAGSSGPLPE
jgi:hypothetical protein